jgi:glycosyltransferase involved in cell wall biosynthesis
MAAAQFRTHIDRVKVIPHICDLRYLLDFSPDAQLIVDAVPGLVDAEFVQVYPAAADRLKDKGLQHIINVCGAIRGQGRSVCCLVLDSWSGRHPREDLIHYKSGLLDRELVFASDIISDFRSLPRSDVLHLMLFSNVFMFPTYGEAFGLCMTEAMLAGAYPVPNGSIPSLREVSGGHGYYPRFIAAKRVPRTPIEQCAHEIIERVQKDVAISAKNSIRRTLNADRVYRDFYETILREATA